jgi:hypothetical protein
MAVLEALAATLSKGQNLVITGEAPSNRTLARARAQTVARALSKFIDVRVQFGVVTGAANNEVTITGART